MNTKYEILIKKSDFEILKVRESTHNFPVHIHKRICTGKIDAGEKFLVTNNKVHILKNGDFFFIPPYMPHSCYVEKGGSVSYTILSADDIRKISKETICNDEINSFIDIKNISLIYEYGLKMLDNYSYSESLTGKLMAYIDEHSADQLSLELLARIVNLNPYYLVHKFKETTGLTPHQYIIQARIRNLKKRFVSDKEILNSALDCGFYDQSHFIRHFKKHVGITPKNYFNSIVYVR
ncbi:MAG: AraC family transcriptional regulator [Spirochaetes bacterium]|nr:AraC family transcriptional regulator [Spirochaetota bacterium]